MDLLEDLLNDLDNTKLYYRVVKNFRKCYSGLMPKRHFIFPQQPYIYKVSNSLCIEFPAWGSYEYRYELSDLQRRLRQNFVMDVHHSDGKIVFLLKKRK